MLYRSRWTFGVVLGMVFWMTSATMAQTPPRGYSVPATYSSVRDSANPFQKTATPPLAADPFQYQQPASEGGFVPARLASLPPEIKLVGVLMLKDRPPIAAIRFPRGGGNHLGEIHYVREGDDIEIPRNLIRDGRSRGVTPGEEDGEILFLKVQKITSQHVEVSSQSNLADRHYLR
ncbi:MAG: hypothetical protein Q4D62_12630 [Planctomycetia bacterium]|nr:hypothetical protein [Planctomycetia bacterium]